MFPVPTFAMRTGMAYCSTFLSLALSTAMAAPPPAGQPARIDNSVKYSDRGSHPATGRSGSASLTIRALLNSDHSTDLELTTGQLDSPDSPPGSISRAQVKVLTNRGTVAGTHNYNSLAGGGYLHCAYAGLPHQQLLQVQASVSGIDGNRTDVVSARTPVLFRPDLAVGDLHHPAQAYRDAPVNISVAIRELNGEVGARTNLVLYVDGDAVDDAAGAWVDAGGYVSAAFTCRLTSLGAHQLTMSAQDAAPGDYDMGNNTVAGDILIVDPTVKLNYEASFDDRDFNYRDRSSSTVTGWSQEASLTCWSNQKSLQWPVERVAVMEYADGVPLPVLSFSGVSSQSEGPDPWRYAVFSGNEYLAAYSIYSGANYTYISYQRSAGSVTYFGHNSRWFYGWDGSYDHIYTYAVNWGRRLPSGSRHGIKLSITDATGTTFEATAVFDLQPYSYTYRHPRYYWWDEGFDDYYYCDRGASGAASDWSNWIIGYNP